MPVDQESAIQRVEEISASFRGIATASARHHEAAAPNVFLRYRAERSLAIVLRSLATDPSVIETLQR